MKTVLIVEDNEADQYLNELTFQKVRPDIKILIAADGQEALDIIKNTEEQIDLILLDINMPGMNGHDFLENHARENPDSDIPVIVMLTSSEQEEDKEKAFHYDFVKDYLLKPFKPETVEQLEKLCD